MIARDDSSPIEEQNAKEKRMLVRVRVSRTIIMVGGPESGA